jgi:hypothetical protein
MTSTTGALTPEQLLTAENQAERYQWTLCVLDSTVTKTKNNFMGSV